MARTHGALIVFGSGPGVGLGVATLFAERGFEKVILMSRNATRLAEEAKAVRSTRAGVDVHEIPIDLGNTEHVRESLKKAEESLGETPLDCVLYNAARMAKSEFFKFSPAGLEIELQISVISLYTVAQWAMPHLLDSAAFDARTPALLVTTGMLAKDPYPAMFSLAAGKAGQYSLVQSLHKQFERQGVHCGLIMIAGTVSDESKVTTSRNIAEETWTAFNKSKGQGDLEVMIEDPAYAEHVKNREKR